MDRQEELKEIARRLRHLQRTSPVSKDGLATWYASTRVFVEWLDSQPSAADLPKQVWHYLHDADIRVREPVRRREQDEMIDGIIASLEQGAVPASVGVTVSFHPRWLGAISLLLLAAIVYWAAL